MTLDAVLLCSMSLMLSVGKGVLLMLMLSGIYDECRF